MLIILLLTCTLSVLSEVETLFSSTIKDNKLIAIYCGIESFNIKARVYELKDGTTADIFNTRKTSDFGRLEQYFALNFLDIPGDLQEDKNKVWLKLENQGYSYSSVPPFMDWVVYMNLNDITLKNDSSLIQFPTHENFPVKGYTINSITNELGSALYVTGGELHSKIDDSYSVSNSFYKYNFTTKEWTDMTYSIGGKLKPSTNHKSVVIGNRYLAVLGGKSPTINNLRYTISNYDESIFEYNSLYKLTIFDTLNNIWESFNANTDIFDSNIATYKFKNFFAAAHNQSIIVYSGMVEENQSNRGFPIRHFGTFDIRSKIWTWTPILNEDGSNYQVIRDERDIQVVNNQVIICTEINEGENHIPIMIYDIPSKRLKSTLRLSDKSNNDDADTDKDQRQNQLGALPIYAIVLIAISCTISLAGLVYLLYRKIKKKQSAKNSKTKYSGPIREVWANPDTDNTNNIISFD